MVSRSTGQPATPAHGLMQRRRIPCMPAPLTLLILGAALALLVADSALAREPSFVFNGRYGKRDPLQPHRITTRSTKSKFYSGSRFGRSDPTISLYVQQRRAGNRFHANRFGKRAPPPLTMAATAAAAAGDTGPRLMVAVPFLLQDTQPRMDLPLRPITSTSSQDIESSSISHQVGQSSMGMISTNNPSNGAIMRCVYIRLSNVYRCSKTRKPVAEHRSIHPEATEHRK